MSGRERGRVGKELYKDGEGKVGEEMAKEKGKTLDYLCFLFSTFILT